MYDKQTDTGTDIVIKVSLYKDLCLLHWIVSYLIRMNKIFKVDNTFIIPLLAPNIFFESGRGGQAYPNSEQAEQKTS